MTMGDCRGANGEKLSQRYSRRILLNLQLLYSNITYGCRNKMSCLKSGMAILKFIEYPMTMYHLGNIKNKRVLDIGAHYRYFGIWLATRGGKVTAVDIDGENMAKYRNLDFFKRNPERLLPCVADGTKLPFAANSFAAVVSVSTIEHIQHDAEVMNEIGKVLSPGGVAVLSFPFNCIDVSWPNPGYVFKMNNAVTDTAVGFTRAYSIASIKERLCTPSGLELVGIDLWKTNCYRWHDCGYLIGMIKSLFCFRRIRETAATTVGESCMNTAILVLRKKS